MIGFIILSPYCNSEDPIVWQLEQIKFTMHKDMEEPETYWLTWTAMFYKNGSTIWNNATTIQANKNLKQRWF